MELSNSSLPASHPVPLPQSDPQLEEEIPDHFYDSDIASVNQKDFLSDNEPPKDTIQERKLLFKEKMLHIFKTIIRVGTHIDKPARYDRIHLRFKAVPSDQIVPRPLNQSKADSNVVLPEHPKYFNSEFLDDCEQISYNLGKDHEEIEKLVTSMKRNQTAVFQLEHLEISKKSNLKLRSKVEVFVIQTRDWKTVIDLDNDGKFMKEVLRKGEGHSRISKHDEVSFYYSIKCLKQNQNQPAIIIKEELFEEAIKIEQSFIESNHTVIWKLMSTMKSKEIAEFQIKDCDLRELEQEKYKKLNDKEACESLSWSWFVKIEVMFFNSIDDIFLDGTLLKKTIIRGISTAKPDSSSLVYYALKITNQKEVLFQDACFESDWWEDFSKLEVLGCRKNYLDDYSTSNMLKKAIKRMKPAEVAEIECRDASLFQWGEDYELMKSIFKFEETPAPIKLTLRVYNFTEGKNCFNMELQEKIIESRRKKAIAINLLEKKLIDKALKKFQNIVSYYSSGKICQESYDQKISALMNCVLCLMKQQRYLEMIPLCNQILQNPKHGFQTKHLKIKGPNQAKIEGKIPEGENDYDFREDADLQQNNKIVEKCRYRKGFALVRLGQNQEALKCLAGITSHSQEVDILRKEAATAQEKYEKKSEKIFKTMFK